MTHRDRAGEPSGHRAGQRAGSREAAGPAGHRQGFPTPATDSPTAGSPARSLWVIINAPWYEPPAVSSPEACLTPAGRARGTGPATAGIRRPLTKPVLRQHRLEGPLAGVKRT